MIEETDYSEEAKYDLFESIKKEKNDWAKCIIARTPPSYEDVNHPPAKASGLVIPTLSNL